MFKKAFRVMTASNKEFLYYSSLEMSASLKAYIQNNYISNGRFFLNIGSDEKTITILRL